MPPCRAPLAPGSTRFNLSSFERTAFRPRETKRGRKVRRRGRRPLPPRRSRRRGSATDARQARRLSRNVRPRPVTATVASLPGRCRRSMNPRALASSQTGRRGHDVRHASMTSAYGRCCGPIHSSRSRIRASSDSATTQGTSRPSAARQDDSRPARRRALASPDDPTEARACRTIRLSPPVASPW